MSRTASTDGIIVTACDKKVTVLAHEVVPLGETQRPPLPNMSIDTSQLKSPITAFTGKSNRAMIHEVGVVAARERVPFADTLQTPTPTDAYQFNVPRTTSTQDIQFTSCVQAGHHTCYL